MTSSLTDNATRCRIYAPVGAHRDLLAYLVRRLLENGANSSFVNQIVDEDVPPEHRRRLPADRDAKGWPPIPSPALPTGPDALRPAPELPRLGPDRCRRPCRDRGRPRPASATTLFDAAPRLAGRVAGGPRRPVTEPRHRRAWSAMS